MSGAELPRPWDGRTKAVVRVFDVPRPDNAAFKWTLVELDCGHTAIAAKAGYLNHPELGQSALCFECPQQLSSNT